MSTEVIDSSELQQTQNDLDSLKSGLDPMKQDFDEMRENVNWEVSTLSDEIKGSVEVKENIKSTPSTCELLDGTNTFTRIEDIISNNQEKFVNVPWNTAKEKVEYIFNRIRSAASEFLKDKLWNSAETERVINNTIAPALEWNLLNLLTIQWKEKNKDMLDSINKISFDNLIKIFDGVKQFAGVEKDGDEPNEVYVKISGWMNAIDYLAVQEKKFWILNYAEHSQILTNPLKFQTYLNDNRFSSKDFSAYENVRLNDLYNLFGVTQDATFSFWISDQEEEEIKTEIWDINVESVDSVSLISKLVGKSEDFLKKTPWLQRAANGLLDGLDSVNNIAKEILNVDVLWEFSKPPEKRGILYKLLDFVCKLIWITWWLDWMVKNWRLDRLNLWDKTDDIVKMFKAYHESAWNWEPLSITDETSCEAALSDFEVTDPRESPTTKGDFLRNAIAMHITDNKVSSLSLLVVQQTLWDSYIKKESINENGKVKEKFVVDETAITEEDILKLAHNHIMNMKNHLEGYKKNNLKDFYTKIHNTDDIAVCMISSLYTNKEYVIEWIETQVFIPEAYIGEPVISNTWWRENLDDWVDTSDKHNVSKRWIYDKAVEYGITDNRQIAYVLWTIEWESGFKNQKEIWWEDRGYWQVDSETWKAYYGRWFIQITHKDNYRRYTQIIRNSWKDFKDNDGNIIKWSDIDLVNNPDIILQSNDLAAFIAMDWMKNGWPYRAENKRLDYYINDNKLDYYNARIIINWMTSKPEYYQNLAQGYLSDLWNWNTNTQVEEKTDKQVESKESILIWKELLAHSKDEIWWLGNSIMTWFQWYKSKLNFPNMDWIESKNTQNHDHRFNSQLDVQWYVAEHPNIKSFMFYFGANTRNNKQTLSDIKKWGEWFAEEWVQPVLCTCIWEDRHTWLKDLNKSLIDLWKEKDWPVFDFSKLYNKWEIPMWWGDTPHPTSAWYSKMAEIINEQLNKNWTN